MPKYFGFEGCGVLLYDPKEERQWFFTEAGFTHDDENEPPQPQKNSKPANKDYSSDEEDIDT